jgi:hypothetical protein
MAITVTVPEQIASVAPKVHYPWVISTTTRPLAVPVTSHGVTTYTTLDTITWTGTNETSTPTFALEEFEMNVNYAPASVKPGQKIYWPVVQTCVVGQTAWTIIPVAGQAVPATPAPAITIATPVVAAEEEWKTSDTISVVSIVISVVSLVGLVYQAMFGMQKLSGLVKGKITPTTTEITIKS